MAKSFKNGVSLHRLLEASPLAALEGFLATVDKGQYAAIFSDVQWASATDAASIQAIRAQLIAIANALAADAAVPLDRHAQRILTLAEGRGVETVTRVAAKLFEQVHIDAFAAQLDDLGRSLWLYQHQSLLFDEAENLFYADHYRNFGRMYEAFELDANAKVDFVWDDAVKAALEEQIQERLELTGRCTVTHLQVDKKDAAGQEIPQHLLIVRHGGPLSSVAEYQEADGSRQERYYRPLNEATLLFSPDEGVIEVFSASPSVRQQVAGCFAETGLKLDLSGKPLTLKQYNMGRFLDSLRLTPPRVDGFDIEHVAVVEVDARPDNYKHRASLKVTADDDTESSGAGLPGRPSFPIHRRGSPMRSTRTLWRWLGVIFLLSFAALGFLGWQIHLQAPPIPKAVVSQDGQVLFGEGEVTRGQQAWLATGGQQLGTVWGHGSYVAPDWSADWLHREAVALRDLWAAQRHGKPYEQLDVEQRGAIEALAPQYPHVHWRLVGNDRLPHPEQPDTTYRDDFLARHRGQPWLQRVQFQGEVDDAALLAAYRACDLLVAPSRYESFGLIYVEAMRAGKPCIGGADGGGGEIITPDIGLAVPTDDPAPLMEALRRLITDAALRQRMGQRARQHYLQQYAEHAFAKRMLALLT